MKPNHRISVEQSVDTNINLILKKEFRINIRHHRIPKSFNMTLYFGIAGYKNEVVMGTHFQYERGAMIRFNYGDMLWYTLYPLNAIYSDTIILYTEIDENKNLWGYFGSDIPINFDKEDREISDKYLLLTPVEMKFLNNELKKDRKAFLEWLNID